MKMFLSEERVAGMADNEEKMSSLINWDLV